MGLSTPRAPAPRFAFDGMRVYAMVGGKRLLCVVATAAGDRVRVVNDLHGVNVWRFLYELEEAPT